MFDFTGVSGPELVTCGVCCDWLLVTAEEAGEEAVAGSAGPIDTSNLSTVTYAQVSMQGPSRGRTNNNQNKIRNECVKQFNQTQVGGRGVKTQPRFHSKNCSESAVNPERTAWRLKLFQEFFDVLGCFCFLRTGEMTEGEREREVEGDGVRVLRIWKSRD